MSYKWVIVVTTYHLGMDDFWDVWEALVLEHFLDFFLVLWKTSYFKCFCFFIFVLKFRQPQFYVSNISNLRTVLNDFALEGVPESVELGQDSCSTYKDLVEKGEVTCQNS